MRVPKEILHEMENGEYRKVENGEFRKEENGRKEGYGQTVV